MNSENCLFCQKFGKKPIYKIDFSVLLNRALFTKYSSGQSSQKNSAIDQLVNSASLKWIIEFKDEIVYEETDEYFKRYNIYVGQYEIRYYQNYEQAYKLDQLFEYYKYHKDIPRFFMKRKSGIILYFHEKKKHFEYQKIKKELGLPQDDDFTEQSQQIEPPPKQRYSKMLIGITDRDLPSNMSTHNLLKQILTNAEPQNISSTWISMENKQTEPDISKRFAQLEAATAPSNKKQKTNTKIFQNLQSLLKKGTYEKSRKLQNILEYNKLQAIYQSTQQQLKQKNISPQMKHYIGGSMHELNKVQSSRMNTTSDLKKFLERQLSLMKKKSRKQSQQSMEQLTKKSFKLSSQQIAHRKSQTLYTESSLNKNKLVNQSNNQRIKKLLFEQKNPTLSNVNQLHLQSLNSIKKRISPTPTSLPKSPLNSFQSAKFFKK